MKSIIKIEFWQLAILALMVIGCKDAAKQTKVDAADTSSKTIEKVAEITIEKLQDSPAYETASLTLKAPKDVTQLPSGAVNFDFEIANYELGVITDSPNINRLANSGKGQHIHFILNNQPYSAHYEPTFSKEIPDGTHHLVAFLSRSYHESVKNENSVVVKKIQVGDTADESSTLDINNPTLIYSRPKGEYSGKDTESVLLDFFVLNTTLSKDGNKVRATINDKTFLITEWVPHVIKGLPMGNNSITLELIDGENNLISGPFNKVTRTVSLKE